MQSLDQHTNSDASFFSIQESPDYGTRIFPPKNQYYELSDTDSKQYQKTIVQLDQNQVLKDINKNYLEEQLAKYPIDDRKYLIIDRNNSMIIDTREQSSMKLFLQKSSEATKSSNLNNFLSLDDNSLNQERKKWQSNSVNKSSIWQDHWKQSQKVHEKFMSAICKNKFTEFYKLLDKRQNSIPIQINYRSESNWCPIHYAAMHASPKIMSCLINHPQIDVNALTDFNWTPLHIAVQSNKFDNCELLLHAGVCMDYRDNQNNTALHYAAEFGYKAIIELLIKNGCSQMIKNIKGLIPRELCKSEDLRNLFKKPSVEEQPQFNFLYRLKRNAFVQKMLLGSNNPKQQIQSSQLSKQPEKPSAFIKNKLPQSKNLNETNKKQQNQKSKQGPSLKKVKTASQNRRKNIFKMYQLIINNKAEPISLSSFKFYRKIGEGAFGQVFVVKKSSKSDKFYALKAIKKQKVIGTALYRYIKTQKDVLSHISHPFIVKLHFAFQTQAYLFLVMDYCEGGDMSRLLEKKQRLEENVVRMYAAEILLGLQALHKNMIIYRDMKPQNIVLDKDGHVCITDFGLSKKTNDLNAVNKSFCGTPAYLPLEIINKKGHTRMADWYEYGVVLYELLTGIPPFYAETKTQLYEKVRQGVIRFPKNSSETFRDLIKKLLAQNPEKRLGFENDAESIKEHEWFKDINWDDVYERKLKVPQVQTKIKIPNEPIKTKFADIKSEKYFIPSWSFIN